MTENNNEEHALDVDFGRLRFWLIKTIEKHDREIEHIKDAVNEVARSRDHIVGINESLKNIREDVKTIDKRIVNVEKQSSSDTTKIGLYGLIGGATIMAVIQWLLQHYPKS